MTGTQVVFYSEGDPTPKHPHHPRTWYSKNLWCTEHHGNCDFCEDVCCAVAGCVQASEDNFNTVEDKIRVETMADDITRLLITAKEASTFIQCTECKKWACPKCISICPTEICQDRLCIECKPERWSKCDWHD